MIKAPDTVNFHIWNNFTIFLAGSIEQGSAEDWQEQLAKGVEQYYNLTLINPRRDSWNSDWKQDINNPQFREQVEWELDCLEDCDLIIMYFQPGSKSPISLLEFGMYAKSSKMIVCCPDGFWRKGNVEVVCAKYKIELLNSMEKLIEVTNKIMKRNSREIEIKL
jgi:hypothetical protein